jgi:hypothetical protein
MAHLQVGNIGSKLRATCYDQAQAVVDISAATSMVLYLKNPSGKLKAFTASLDTNGTDGRLQYTTTAATDLNEHGKWKAQGKITIGTQVIWSNIVYLPVDENLTP